jgi:hypothetical protein
MADSKVRHTTKQIFPDHVLCISTVLHDVYHTDFPSTVVEWPAMVGLRSGESPRQCEGLIPCRWQRATLVMCILLFDPTLSVR